MRLGLHYRQAAKLKSLMASGSAAQQQDFGDLCAKNDFAVNDFREQWIDFPEFLSYLPTLRSQNYDAMLATTAVQEMRDSHSQYYFQIDEVRREGEPIPLERLRPTIRRILFNRRQGEVIGEQLAAGDLVLDTPTRSLRCGEKSVRLGFKEFDVLRLLLAAPRAVIPKEDIISKVWGLESEAEDNNVEVYISFLRKKLAYLGSRVSIGTVRKVGYHLEVPAV